MITLSESKGLPIAADVDVLVVGGGPGVAALPELARDFLLRLWL